MYVLDFEIYNEFAELHCNHTLKKPVIYVVEEDAMNAKIIDVGIITIVSTEIQALLNIFHADINDWEEIGMQRYYHASVFSEQVNRELSIVITSPKREGNTNCAITTTKFLYDWYPRIICLVGIGAGIRGKIRIGDVILPKKIHDYTVKKYERRKYTPRSESMDWPDCIDNMLKYHPFNERAFAETCEKELDKDILDARYKAERLLSSRGVAEDFNYIITPPDLVFLHTRMPVIFDARDTTLLQSWLDPSAMPPWDEERVLEKAVTDMVYEKRPWKGYKTAVQRVMAQSAL